MAIMTVQQIIDTGQVEVNESTDTLEAALGMLEVQIDGLQNANWGPVGLARLQAHRRLKEKIETLLKTRRGIDGMTPLNG